MPAIDDSAASFEKLCQSIRHKTTVVDFKKFSDEKDKIKRFEIFDKIQPTDLVNTYLTVEYGKNLQKALQFKSDGNREFKAQNWEEALECYNQSYLLTPGGNVKEISVVLGNRSACLVHLGENQLAINDISRAVPNFDCNTVYKLLLRKAKCHMALEEYSMSLNEFTTVYQMMQVNTTVPSKQREMILDEVMLLTKFLRRNVVDSAETQSMNEPTPQFWRADSYLNPKYKFDYTEREGRYAVCLEDIKVGEKLLSETPFCSVVLQEYTHSHCQLCCARTIAPIACDSCADIIYCSDQCKAEATFHQFECGVLKSFWRSKASVTCHLSMRMMGCYPLDFFENIRGDLSRKMTHDEVDALQSRDYRKAFALVTHEDLRTDEEMFQRSLMAKFLLDCLVMKGYLGKRTDLRYYIGNLILHNIQVLQFNAHEIFELQKDENDNIGRTEFIGGAIFPVLALFNHSCDPATVRYFEGKRVHVHTVRPLKAGEQIGENYGPIFTLHPKEERQLNLKTQYKFECKCEPCEQNWPLFKQMNNNVMRLRCKVCGLVTPVLSNTTKLVFQCQKCSNKTSIVEILKYLSKVDSMFEIAKNLFNEDKIDLALKMYLKLLDKMNKYLAPPYADFHICQQGIRRCFLESGNLVRFKKPKNTMNSSYFM